MADETGSLTLVFFHGAAEHLQRTLPVGERRFVSGSVEWYEGLPQIVHPDHVVAPADFEHLPLIEPVYPLSEGLSGKVLARAIRTALEAVPALPEWQDEAFRQRHGWPDFAVALRTLHHPETPAALSPDAAARMRLAYDELLANQLALSLVRSRMKKAKGRSLAGDGERRAKIVAALPYRLTDSQAAAIEEILRDMAAPERMLRLLQGDVGSGKTVVALVALTAAIESGAQGAFMVPTEILARQHFANLQALLHGGGDQARHSHRPRKGPGPRRCAGKARERPHRYV